MAKLIHCQFLEHMIVSTILEDKELIKASNILQPVLNTDSEETLEIGVANKSHAMICITLYLEAF